MFKAARLQPFLMNILNMASAPKRDGGGKEGTKCANMVPSERTGGLEAQERGMEGN